MKEAIESWRLVIYKRKAPRVGVGERLLCFIPSSPHTGWDGIYSPSLCLTTPPGGQMKNFPEPTASWNVSRCPLPHPLSLLPPLTSPLLHQEFTTIPQGHSPFSSESCYTVAALLGLAFQSEKSTNISHCPSGREGPALPPLWNTGGRRPP